MRFERAADSGRGWEVARIREGHVQKVIVVSPDDTGIAQARTKTTGSRLPCAATCAVC